MQMGNVINRSFFFLRKFKFISLFVSEIPEWLFCKIAAGIGCLTKYILNRSESVILFLKKTIYETGFDLPYKLSFLF